MTGGTGPHNSDAFTDREVYGGGDNPHGWRWRARIEQRVKRGRDQWRFVGEQHYISWRDNGPGFDGGRHSRWRYDRERVIAEANDWLDQKEYDPRSEAVGYV